MNNMPNDVPNCLPTQMRQRCLLPLLMLAMLTTAVHSQA